MFEKTILGFDDNDGSVPEVELLIGNTSGAAFRGGGALRAIEWNEVTARLNAARDLRQLMRQDGSFNIAGGASSFGDAAATCFREIKSCEQDVNLEALRQGKVSNGIGDQTDRNAATGDARDDR